MYIYKVTSQHAYNQALQNLRINIRLGSWKLPTWSPSKSAHWYRLDGLTGWVGVRVSGLGVVASPVCFHCLNYCNCYCWACLCPATCKHRWPPPWLHLPLHSLPARTTIISSPRRDVVAVWVCGSGRTSVVGRRIAVGSPVSSLLSSSASNSGKSSGFLGVSTRASCRRVALSLAVTITGRHRRTHALSLSGWLGFLGFLGFGCRVSEGGREGSGCEGLGNEGVKLKTQTHNNNNLVKTH